MDSLRLYVRLIACSLRGQLAYRATFLTKLVGNFAVTVFEFLGIWALFTRFGTLGGWTLREVALLYGTVDVGFALADMLSRGFDRFGTILKAGEFDRMLLRPRSTVLQLLGYELRLFKLGRLAQGAIILAWAAGAVDWTPARVGLLGFSIAGTYALFLGIIVLQATSAFWTIETLEVWSAFTYGGNYAGEYPLSIYKRWFQRVFTAVIPLGLTTYYPARAILGRDDLDGFHAVAPLGGIVFAALAFGVWRLGLRRHASTGS